MRLRGNSCICILLTLWIRTTITHLRPARRTLPEFVFNHRIVSSAGTAKFFTRHDLTDVEQGKAGSEDNEHDGDTGEEFHGAKVGLPK